MAPGVALGVFSLGNASLSGCLAVDLPERSGFGWFHDTLPWSLGFFLDIGWFEKQNVQWKP